MYSLLRPLLFQLEAEQAHDWAMNSAAIVQAVHPSLVSPFLSYTHPKLRQTLWALEFSGPLGLAAGADKNARLVPFWQALGMGYVEVGSVTAQPAKGNARPRAFRLPKDNAVVNRMGLNNEGAEKVAVRLAQQQHRFRVPVGINIAKTHSPDIMGERAVADFVESFRRLAPLASYVTLNISCPNTAEGKTFEDPESLEALLVAVTQERERLSRPIPLLLKLSPPADLTALEDIYSPLLSLVKKYSIDGLVATNTASDRSQLTTDTATLERIGRGGLSGKPLFPRALATVRYLYRATQGKLPIVGVGGVRSVEDAYAMIRAGASLLQVYTGMIYEGPGLIKRIHKGLVANLERDGFATLADAVGSESYDLS